MVCGEHDLRDYRRAGARSVCVLHVAGRAEGISGQAVGKLRGSVERVRLFHKESEFADAMVQIFGMCLQSADWRVYYTYSTDWRVYYTYSADWTVCGLEFGHSGSTSLRRRAMFIVSRRAVFRPPP